MSSAGYTNPVFARSGTGLVWRSGFSTLPQIGGVISSSSFEREPMAAKCESETDQLVMQAKMDEQEGPSLGAEEAGQAATAAGKDDFCMGLKVKYM